MSTCINKGDHLLVEVDEHYTLKLLMATVYEVADHCRADNVDKVLIDFRNVKGSLSIFERFQLGMEIVKAWDQRIKVAVIARPGFINRMTENMVVNRGVKLFVTTSTQDAAQWLEIRTQDQIIG